MSVSSCIAVKTSMDGRIKGFKVDVFNRKSRGCFLKVVDVDAWASIFGDARTRFAGCRWCGCVYKLHFVSTLLVASADAVW